MYLHIVQRTKVEEQQGTATKTTVTCHFVPQNMCLHYIILVHHLHTHLSLYHFVFTMQNHSPFKVLPIPHFFFLVHMVTGKPKKKQHRPTPRKLMLPLALVSIAGED